MITKVTGSGERISTYTVDDSQMATGSTIGSPKGVVIIKANGAIEKFFAVDAGKTVIGGMQIGFWDDDTKAVLTKLPGECVIHPDSQEHVYELNNGLTVREKAFLLNGEPEVDCADPAIAYYVVELECGDTPARVCSIGAAEMRGDFGLDTRVRYDARRTAFTASNASDPRFARAFACSRKPRHWEVTGDHGKCSRIRCPAPLADAVRTRTRHECIALFEHAFHLRPRQRVRIVYRLIAASGGRRELHRLLDGAPSVDDAFRRTRARYDRLLKRAVVMTPDAVVNRGVLWAKANMLRVEVLAPTGWCFVNDPTRSNNSVARDTAWFAYGADYVTPDFSRESLLRYVEHLERRGKVVEYYDILNGKSADYKLNINDDTPLIVLALWHHYATTGDVAFLKSIYRAAKRAVDYVLSQRNDLGLVWCSARGTADWGIPGWRNVIKECRISGATTELNSECYAALEAVSKMAKVLKKRQDSTTYRQEAVKLREAINEHLVDPDTGLYYLCIDVDGTKRTDVTCDLVFPVMFGVADRERAARIVSRLSVTSFWTRAGMRTVPNDDIDYGPTHGSGLLGGVWVGVTFWYAFAAARFNPDFMASALRDSFRHYSRDPRRNNTVPGQFSEWLHGDTLVNQGMMLSPWFPPRYLWAAIEGAAGLDLSGDEPACSPQLSPEWRWLGVRRLRFRGRFVSWFVAKMPGPMLYATFDFKQPDEYEAFDRDVTDRYITSLDDDVAVIALERNGRIVVFVGNTADRTVTTSVKFRENLGGRFLGRVYGSMRGDWIDAGHISGAALRDGVALEIDRRGFCVVELSRIGNT